MNYKNLFWIVFSMTGLIIIVIGELGFEMNINKTSLFGLMMATFGISFKKGLDE